MTHHELAAKINKLDFDKKWKRVSILSILPSGSKHLHALLDGHSSVMTLPGINYTNSLWEHGEGDSIKSWESFLKRVSGHIEFQKIVDTKKDGLTADLFNDGGIQIDQKEFIKIILILLAEKAFSYLNFYCALHIAYDIIRGGDPLGKDTIVHGAHTYWRHEYNVKRGVTGKILITVRDPLKSLYSRLNRSSPYIYYTYGTRYFYRLLAGPNRIAQLGQPYLIVPIEELNSHPKETMEKVFSFCELDFEESFKTTTLGGVEIGKDTSVGKSEYSQLPLYKVNNALISLALSTRISNLKYTNSHQKGRWWWKLCWLVPTPYDVEYLWAPYRLKTYKYYFARIKIQRNRSILNIVFLIGHIPVNPLILALHLIYRLIFFFNFKEKPSIYSNAIPLSTPYNNPQLEHPLAKK